jgi:hypothetical protein
MDLNDYRWNWVAPLPSVSAFNSPYGILNRGGGYHLSSEVTIAGTGAEVEERVFKISGLVEIIGIYGIFTDVTEVTSLTAAGLHFCELVPVQMTSAAGTDISGAALGSVIAKQDVAASAITFLDAANAKYSESAVSARALAGGVLMSKDGLSDYIVFSVTTDANSDCIITFHCQWAPMTAGSSVVTP